MSHVCMLRAVHLFEFFNLMRWGARAIMLDWPDLECNAQGKIPVIFIWGLWPTQKIRGYQSRGSQHLFKTSADFEASTKTNSFYDPHCWGPLCFGSEFDQKILQYCSILVHVYIYT